MFENNSRYQDTKQYTQHLTFKEILKIPLMKIKLQELLISFLSIIY